ncbi:unnamed protein product [Phytophthora lilii]|uniref:Unnamed protein product n=1 Tax=Phytophthora lilii TaxID=2077276 RepID=A0A9W6WMQ7_9STRA|nr:unnamed protein product [Phytophthora lilii]
MNTPQALREYMQQMGVEETPAATNFSTVSDKILFVIKNGKLHKRRNGKPDVNLEENTVASRAALRGVDPIFTMIAIKHSIEPGVRISNNNLYAQEAKEIRESGKLLTHEEAHELNARARRDLPAIEDPSSLTTPKQTDKRDRGESFYNNTTPVIEEKKKLKVNEGSLRPYRGEEIGFAKLNLRGRGLMGAGVNGTRILEKLLEHQNSNTNLLEASSFAWRIFTTMC